MIGIEEEHGNLLPYQIVVFLEYYLLQQSQYILSFGSTMLTFQVCKESREEHTSSVAGIFNTSTGTRPYWVAVPIL